MPKIQAQKSRDMEVRIKARPVNRLARSPSHQKKLGVAMHTCHPSYVGGISRRIMVQISQGKKGKSKK
jgi:hypothetical protein